MALVLSTVVAGACSTFGTDDPQQPGVTSDADASTTPDGSTAVTGTPDRGIKVTVGDPKATNFVMQNGSLDLPVKLTRRDSSMGAVLVSVTNLPADVTAEPITIPMGKNDGTITLKAKATSVQGGPKMADVTALEQGPLGTGASTKLTTFVRGGRGALDTTFGDKGTLINLFRGGEALAQDARTLHDGSIMIGARASNQLVLLRLTSTGVTDTKFTGGGVAVVSGGQSPMAFDLAEPPVVTKGFIYVLETMPSTPKIYRLNLDGTKDLGFNGTGQVILDDGLGGSAAQQGLQIFALPDGKALVSSFRIGSATATTVTRWNADGSRDDTYGTGGSCQIAGARQMVLRPGGAVFMSSTSGMQGCTAAGLLDTTVGASPDYAVAGVGGSDSTDVARTPAGGVAFLGSLGPQTYSYWTRLTPALVKDAAIGLLGKVATPLKDASSIVVQQDGGVLVGGALDDQFQVVRYTPNGAVDPTFGAGGTTSFTISSNARLSKLVEQPDGRILAMGKSDNTTFDASMARFWP